MAEGAVRALAGQSLRLYAAYRPTYEGASSDEVDLMFLPPGADPAMANGTILMGTQDGSFTGIVRTCYSANDYVSHAPTVRDYLIPPG